MHYQEYQLFETQIKKKKFFKGMIRSQFRYCALIYMFSSRKPSNLDNKLYERSLRIDSGDSNSKF